MRNPKVMEQGSPVPAGGLVIVSRLTWMIMGPFILLAVTYRIATQGGGWATWSDAGFGAIVAIMIASRYMEIRSGAAQTARGEPASFHHFTRYLWVLLASGACVWVAANYVGNHLLG